MKTKNLLFLSLLFPLFISSCKEEPQPVEPDSPSISISPSSVEAPAEGGSYSIVAESNFDDIRFNAKDSWASIEASAPKEFTLTVAPNDGDARSSDIVFRNENGKAVAHLAVSQAPYVKPHVDPDPGTDPEPVTGGIATAKDLVDFAAAVNAGESTEKWQNEEGTVVLLNDIDMASVSKWTPIGYPLCARSTAFSESSGHAFTGSFDGGGFTIKNLKLKATISEKHRNYGFFGTLGPGAVVKNIFFDSSCSLDVTANVQTSVGMLVGYAYGSEIRDIANHGSITVTGSSAGLTFAGAIAGALYSSAGYSSIMDSCNNFGSILFNNGDASALEDYKAYTVAGIAGFVDNGDTSNRVIISECTNSGDIESYAARSGGIVGTASKDLNVTNCENRGNITNSYATKWQGRAGGIVAVTGANTTTSGCRNYGKIVCTNYGYTGGITGNIAKTGIVITGCENYGTVLSASAGRGLIFGYVKGYVAKISSCYVDGKVGSIGAPNNINNPGWDEHSEAEKTLYIGYPANTSSTPEYSDITYGFESSSGPAVDYENAKLKILFIGNSFTMDAVNRLPGFVKAAGLDKIQLTFMYYGGRTIPEYYDGWATKSDYNCYQCGPGRSGWTTESSKHTLKEMVSVTDWDYITIQEHTGTPSAWDWEAASSRVPAYTEKQAVEGIAKLMKQDCPNKNVKIYYILSQAYGSSTSILTKHSQYFTGQDGMFTCICNMAKKVMATGLFDGIISTGAMLQNLRGTSLNTPMDLTRDGYHMDYGVSRYGASVAVFESLITPSAYGGGKNLDGTTYRVTDSNTEQQTYCTPVDDAGSIICIKAARAAIEKPFEVTKIQ